MVSNMTDKVTVDALFPSRTNFFIKNDYKNAKKKKLKERKKEKNDHMLSNKATVNALFISNKGPLFFSNFELPPVATAISA